MADLEIKFTGSSQELLKELKAVTGELKKVEKATGDVGKGGQEATGYIGGLQNQMKLMRAQMKSASQDELPSLRTQFLQLRQTLREAQYGTESFTSKIGGQFENALNKTTKKLFDFKAALKLTAGAVGLGAITAQLLRSTGAADALAGAIDNVVESIKNVGKAQIQVDLAKGVDVLKVGQQFLDSQLPANIAIIKTMTDEVDKLTAKLSISNAAKAIRAAGGVPQGSGFLKTEGGVATFNPSDIISEKDEAATRNRLALLQEYIVLIGDLKNGLREVTGEASFDRDPLTGSDFLEPKNAFSPFGATAGADDERNFLLRRLPQVGSPLPRIFEDDPSALMKDYDQRIKMEEKIASQRVEIADRYAGGLSNIFEQAASAGFRGGFDDFVVQYLQQTGIKTLSTLLRLGLSSSFGGSFGTGPTEVVDIVGSIFGFAGGGEFYTRGPQMIMVGDNPGGVERVTVEPVSGKGQTRMIGGALAMAGGGSIEPIRSSQHAAGQQVVREIADLYIDSQKVDYAIRIRGKRLNDRRGMN